MGKHEVIGSAARVAKHRAAMLAKGLRPQQVWVPDIRNPDVMTAIRRANSLIAAHPKVEEDVMAWVEAMNEGTQGVEPDYKW